MECGFPVNVPVDGEGQIEGSKLPGGKVVTAMHIGPYDTLAETYEVVLSWIRRADIRSRMTCGKPYPTNPCEVPDSSKWMTEIFYPKK